MSHLSLMNHTAIQIFTTKTYHNYAYILKHTRTLTNNKYRIARSQNTNSIHTHTTTTKTYYSYIPTTKINIIHHQQTYLRRTLQKTQQTLPTIPIPKQISRRFLPYPLPYLHWTKHAQMQGRQATNILLLYFLLIPLYILVEKRTTCRRRNN